jgi:hypothetical protein
MSRSFFSATRNTDRRKSKSKDDARETTSMRTCAEGLASPDNYVGSIELRGSGAIFRAIRCKFNRAGDAHGLKAL